MKCSKDNRYEHTAQLLFVISGVVFLLAHLYGRVILPVVYIGWGYLERYPRYIVESISYAIRMLAPLLRAGVLFLMAWTIKKRKQDMAVTAAVLLCIDGVLRIVFWWGWGTLYTIGMFSNLAALLLVGIAIALKKRKPGRELLIIAMVLFGVATVPEVVEICCFASGDPSLAMEEAAWAIEAIVFVYFCYCLQKRKIRWIEAEKPGAGNTTRNAANGDGWPDEIVELEKAAQLHKQGVLTEEEFQKMKSEILKKKEGEQK